MNTLEILTTDVCTPEFRRHQIRFDLIKAALTSVAASEINPLAAAEYAIRCADAVLALLEQETSETLPSEDLEDLRLKAADAVLARLEKEGK